MSVAKEKTLTDFLAIDCEFVRIEGNRRNVARVSIVNSYGYCVYNQYVKPRSRVINYLTPVSGITKNHLRNAELFTNVRQDVAALIRGRILVGHALDYDLKGLGLCHPEWNKRDTSKFPPFLQIAQGQTPGLKFLANKILHKNIQEGSHCSIEDACAAMDLYLKVDTLWEALLDVEYGSESDSEYTSSSY